MKTLSVILNLLSLTLCLAAARASTVYTLNTSAREFNTGVLNQGWWSDFTGNNTYNDNYIIALFWTAPSSPFQQGNVERNFFTFDLTGISGTIQSATLLLRRGKSGSPNPTETIDFWDVQTPVAVLNNNTGPDASIVSDLGSGRNYGSFQVAMSGSASEVLSFALNANAIADLNASLDRYFSIGGSMEGQPAPGIDRFLFGVSQGFPGQLQLTVVPEPAAGYLIFVWSICAGLVRSRRHSKTAEQARCGEPGDGARVDNRGSVAPGH
jgi:hypothetical protein